jgi:hypothetical protein
MRIHGDGSEILLSPKILKIKNARARDYVCLCARELAKFWGHIALLILAMVADAIDFIQSPTSQH